MSHRPTRSAISYRPTLVVGQADEIAGVTLVDELGNRAGAKNGNVVRMGLDGGEHAGTGHMREGDGLGEEEIESMLEAAIARLSGVVR
jgi:uncharacterized membrane-anchored protein